MIKLLKLLELGINSKSLKYNSLIKLLYKVFDEDFVFFNDMDIYNYEDIYKEYKGPYIIRELIALQLDKVLDDFYIRCGNIIMDNVNYTNHYIEANKWYEREIPKIINNK